MKSLITENGDNILPTLVKMGAEGDLRKSGPAMMDNIMQNMRAHMTRNTLNHVAWEHAFQMIGKIGMDLHPNFDATKFRELLIAKHRLYGPGPIIKWGPLGVVIRIDSKWERYKNLTENPAVNAGDESLVDTLTDIIGYAVLGCLLVTQGQ